MESTRVNTRQGVPRHGLVWEDLDKPVRVSGASIGGLESDVTWCCHWKSCWVSWCCTCWTYGNPTNSDCSVVSGMTSCCLSPSGLWSPVKQHSVSAEGHSQNNWRSGKKTEWTNITVLLILEGSQLLKPAILRWFMFWSVLTAKWWDELKQSITTTKSVTIHQSHINPPFNANGKTMK